MYHKNNPWLSLVALLIMALILVFTCTGCTDAEAAEMETEPAPRFTQEIHQISAGEYAHIITDTETGVKYLFVDGYKAGGLCKLED